MENGKNVVRQLSIIRCEAIWPDGVREPAKTFIFGRFTIYSLKALFNLDLGNVVINLI